MEHIKVMQEIMVLVLAALTAEHIKMRMALITNIILTAVIWETFLMICLEISSMVMKAAKVLAVLEAEVPVVSKALEVAEAKVLVVLGIMEARALAGNIIKMHHKKVPIFTQM